MGPPIPHRVRPSSWARLAPGEGPTHTRIQGVLVVGEGARNAARRPNGLLTRRLWSRGRGNRSDGRHNSLRPSLPLAPHHHQGDVVIPRLPATVGEGGIKDPVGE